MRECGAALRASRGGSNMAPMSEPTPPLPFPFEPTRTHLESLARQVVERAIAHWTSLAGDPSFDLDGAEAVAASFREPAPEGGRPLGPLLDRLETAFKKSFHTTGPGYLAFIPGGGLPSAALADLLSLAFNRFVNVRAAAPAVAEIEATVLRWIAEEMGYGAGSGGILTSGGSLSNLTAVATARAARLGDDFTRGTIYFSGETHHSVEKAARIAGFSERSFRRVPTDSALRIDPGALERAILSDAGRGARPFLVVANAGTTNTGAVDPMRDVAAVARRHGLWVHADAAYGGFFRLLPECAGLLAGIEESDSITLDPHKGLFLPYGTGCLLVRERKALLDLHRGGAAYLQDVEGGAAEPNFTDLSPELSRDFRGLRLWLPVMLHGLGAFRAALREKLALTRLAHEEIRRDGRFEVLHDPALTVLAFRLRAEGRDEDALNALLLKRVNARRRVFLSSTRTRGRYWIRICVLSFRTHEDRIRDAIAGVKEEASAVLAGPAA